MVEISNIYFSQDGKKEGVECPYCGYKITKPYPKNQLCPKCSKFLATLFEISAEKEETLTKQLIQALNTKKQEGEKNYDFDRRLKETVNRLLEL